MQLFTGGNSHLKVTGVLVASLWGCKLQILVKLRMLGMESHYMCPLRYRLVLYIKKFTTNALTLTTQKSLDVVSLSFSYTHIGLLKWEFPRAVIQTTNKILSAIDKRKLTPIVLLDMSKAFDSINHRILLAEKLQDVGSSYQ